VATSTRSNDETSVKISDTNRFYFFCDFEDLTTLKTVSNQSLALPCMTFRYLGILFIGFFRLFHLFTMTLTTAATHVSPSLAATMTRPVSTIVHVISMAAAAT